jgi:hypothetical protein
MEITYKINEKELAAIRAKFPNTTVDYTWYRVTPNVEVSMIFEEHPVFVAELRVKNDNPALLRHFFNKVILLDNDTVMWDFRTFEWSLPLTPEE